MDRILASFIDLDEFKVRGRKEFINERVINKRLSAPF